MLLIRGANSLLALIVCQALLGLASWYVKFGVPSWGVVAQLNSAPQVIVCSLHKVVGMLTLMTSVVNLFYANSVQVPSNGFTTHGREFEGSMMGVAT